VITVDASDSGWGISSHLMETVGHWTPEEKASSINTRELMTILFVLQLHGKKYQGKNILIYTDNITALKYAAKAGGTASITLQEWPVI
jgi:hypothetical protein